MQAYWIPPKVPYLQDFWQDPLRQLFLRRSLDFAASITDEDSGEFLLLGCLRLPLNGTVSIVRPGRFLRLGSELRFSAYRSLFL